MLSRCGSYRNLTTHAQGEFLGNLETNLGEIFLSQKLIELTRHENAIFNFYLTHIH